MSEPADEVSHLNPPTAWAIATAFALLFFSWGTTYYATSLAMKDYAMPPALFGGIRLLFGGTILLTIQLCRGQPVRISLGQALRLFVVSSCLFLGANLLINIGQQTVPSGVAAILIATTPLWMGLFAMLWPEGERLSWHGWLGLLIGFAGIVVTMAPQVQDGFDLLDDYRHVFILGSAAAWAIGSLFSRHMALKIPHLTSAAYQMLLGGASQTVVGTCWNEWPDLIEHITPYSLATFAYCLFVGSLTGFVAFNWLLGHVSIAKVGTYAYINPVIAVCIGWIMGETQVHSSLVVGIAVILVGVYLVRSDHRPSKEIELEPD